MQERRRYKRQVLVMYLHVFDLETGKVVGYLADLSVHGLMTVGERPLENGKELNLGIRRQKLESDLHYVNSKEDSYISVRAQTRWHSTVSDGLHGTGFMFTEISAEATAEIENLIASIGEADDPDQDTHIYHDVLVCIGGNPSGDDLQRAADYMCRQEGVVSASFEDDSPHLLVVQYRRDRIKPDDVLGYVSTLTQMTLDNTKPKLVDL